MTHEELFIELKSTGYPVAYAVFATPQKLPFIVYETPDNDDMHADNTHFFEVVNGFVELYTTKKDLKAERKVEAVFIKNKMPYRKETSGLIDKEKVFYCRWSFQFY